MGIQCMILTIVIYVEFQCVLHIMFRISSIPVFMEKGGKIGRAAGEHPTFTEKVRFSEKNTAVGKVAGEHPTCMHNFIYDLVLLVVLLIHSVV